MACSFCRDLIGGRCPAGCGAFVSGKAAPSVPVPLPNPFRDAAESGCLLIRLSVYCDHCGAEIGGDEPRHMPWCSTISDAREALLRAEFQEAHERLSARLLEIETRREIDGLGHGEPEPRSAPLPTNLDAPAATSAAVGEYERGIADTLKRVHEALDDVAQQHGTMGDLVIGAVKEALAARGLVVGATVRVGGEG